MDGLGCKIFQILLVSLFEATRAAASASALHKQLLMLLPPLLLLLLLCHVRLWPSQGLGVP